MNDKRLEEIKANVEIEWDIDSDDVEFLREQLHARDAYIAQLKHVPAIASMTEYREFQNALAWLNKQDAPEAEWVMLMIRRLHALKVEVE